MEKFRSFFLIYKKRIYVFFSALLVIFSIVSFAIINEKYKAKEVDEVTLEDNEVESFNVKEEAIKDKTIKVDIKGAVANEGVYELKEDSRVIDAVIASGGLLENASTRYLNLSKKLTDEAVIIVNTIEEINLLKEKDKNELPCEKISNACVEKKEVVTDIIYSEVLEEAKTETDKEELNTVVNINTASLEDLTKLDGIGESKAQKIIDYRNENGPFKSIEDIRNISGIGEKIYESIKEYIKAE